MNAKFKCVKSVKLFSRFLLAVKRARIVLRDLLPVYQLPDLLDELEAKVLVVHIIGVLPYVNG